ncbi:MAG: invasion associated locus B family protein [Pseudomonadota bacterium]
MRLVFKFLIIFFLSLPLFAQETEDKAATDKDKKTETQTASESDYTSLGVFHDWEAFFLEQDNEVLCWISSKGIYNNNEETAKQPIILTSMRPLQNIRDEISFFAGDTLDEKQKVKVNIDKKVFFELSPEGEWAWLRSKLNEGRFVVASRHGNILTTHFTNGSGKALKASFSLKGYTAAFEKTVEKCADFFPQNMDESEEKNENKDIIPKAK